MLTRPTSRPASPANLTQESARANASSIESGSVTSSCRTSTRSDSPASARAESSGPRRDRSRMEAATRRPRRASSTTVRRPKPEEHPVTRITPSWFRGDETGGSWRVRRPISRRWTPAGTTPRAANRARAVRPIGWRRPRRPSTTETMVADTLFGSRARAHARSSPSSRAWSIDAYGPSGSPCTEPASHNPVRTDAGSTMATETPRGAISWASDSAQPSSAHLEPQ